MKERTEVITMKGAPLTLVGNQLKVGDNAPDFTLVDNDMKPFSFDKLKGKPLIVSTVPSLDTPTCDMETRRFNKEAAGLNKDVEIITISKDLPFAQKRWCAAAGADRVTTLSDYRNSGFANDYGVLIKELGLLARVVFVIDRQGVIQYIQVVKEVSEEPEYSEILETVKKLS
jgi:thioredoxin-dependent peroxiredoxin